MTNYGDQFMCCPECGGTAEAECVDVGVGLYIKDEYECPCGYNSAADGRANVGSYDDWFVDGEADSDIIDDLDAAYDEVMADHYRYGS